MNKKLAVVLYLCVASVCSAPMQLPYLPMQYGMQPQLPFLRQIMPNMQAPNVYPQQQPLVIVLPNPAAAPNPETDDRYVNLNEQVTNNLKSNTGHIDENKDAVVVDANPKNPETQPKNAIVYLPEEGRFSLGQIISYIPFLPIEINVPDTISWIGHLISGGLFRPQGGMKTLGNKGQMPIIVMPYPAPVPQMPYQGQMPAMNQ
ncbi:uncharacterized protein LOC110370494 [Helicoverpa armigera]|uniref:uncharacterized protein LOC110370494 n=1 Tax=Helicoverpa armigera TaxID=29058 RepID=UPI003082F525